MNRKLEKIIWDFAEWCLNTPLLERASERNDIKYKIHSKTKTINEHLFKYYLMPESIDRLHWLSEIDDRLFEILDLKWNKVKRFKKDEYFDMLYTYFYLKDDYNIDYKNIIRIFSNIEEKYKTEYQKDYTLDDFIEKVGNIIKNISQLLENNDYDKISLIEEIKIFDNQKIIN